MILLLIQFLIPCPCLVGSKSGLVGGGGGKRKVEECPPPPGTLNEKKRERKELDFVGLFDSIFFPFLKPKFLLQVLVLMVF